MYDRNSFGFGFRLNFGFAETVNSFHFLVSVLAETKFSFSSQPRVRHDLSLGEMIFEELYSVSNWDYVSYKSNISYKTIIESYKVCLEMFFGHF